jgi:TldD protein
LRRRRAFLVVACLISGTSLLLSQRPSAGPASSATAKSKTGEARAGGDPFGDVILRAMRTELGRSRTLKLMGVDVPYFIEYSVDDTRSYAASASLGALITSRWSRARVPRVQVRVGTPEFDNTNSIFSDLPGGPRFDSDQLPLDNNELAIRQQLWLATDRAYKGAVQAISRKRAALRNIAQPEQMPDFAAAKPSQIVQNPGAFEFDAKVWTAKTKTLSALFRSFPEVLSSAAEFEAVQSTAYYMNTEGSYYRIPDTLAFLRVTATAQAADGMTFHDAALFQALTVEGLPPDAEMRKGIQKVAADLTALTKAPRGDRYSGPVLFEPQASAQIFAAVLARSFVIPRKPVSQPNFPLPFLSSELEGRVGSRVLPDWMDVVDDPTQKEWRGRPLFGVC